MDYCIDDFITYQGTECLISCFQNYFKYFSIDVNESDIYFLGEGFFTIYEKSILNEKFDVTIKSCVHEAIENFCELYNIKFEHYKNISYTKAHEIMQNCIDDRNPIIVKVDASCLKHSPVFINANDITHYISVIGLSGNKVLISDGFIPTIPPSNYQGWSESALLEEGRKKTGYECIVIDENSLKCFKSQWNRDNINDLLRHKVSLGVRKYLNGNEENNIYYGISALQKFSSEIPYLMEFYGSRYTEQMLMLNHKIRIWGLMASRVLLGQLVLNINNCGKDFIDSTLIDDIANICKKWNSFCFLVVRAALSERKNDLELLVQRMNEIINDERDIFDSLLECI